MRSHPDGAGQEVTGSGSAAAALDFSVREGKNHSQLSGAVFFGVKWFSFLATTHSINVGLAQSPVYTRVEWQTFPLTAELQFLGERWLEPCENGSDPGVSDSRLSLAVTSR